MLGLVKQNGFYSYENMCGLEKFGEELPGKEKCYSSMAGEKISDKDYEHVFKVWDKFKMKAMNDYYNLHCKCDALMLADVFEKLRNSRLKTYGLLN